ncbi:MAG: hypothetical protein EOP51_10760 [Sphingobacteriales bacterium]|nr:MAG: hypothetical protein EOP51_10760 [Sphingobacteriales bacterium]
MIRKLLSIACILLLAATAQAQTPTVQYSNTFEEPEDGWNKILQLKDGKTFFFHFTKEGIEVNVYTDKKLTAKKVITSKLWDAGKMRASVVEGLYEINGQPVIFLKQTTDRTPKLFRIALNNTTGAIDNESKLGELDKYKMGAGYAMAFGSVEEADFHVEKDPASDNYAVVNYNTFAHESDRRIEVVHYGVENGQHKELNRAFYDAGDFKYIEYISMTVLGDKSVFVCSYGYNTASSGGKDSRVIVSRLSKGKNAFTHKLLEFTDDFKSTQGFMQYNPGTNMLQLLTLTYMKTKSKMFSSKSTSYYATLISYIDPESLYIVSTKPVMNEKTSDYIVSKLGGESYNGLPQQMIINPDNSTTVLSEEMQAEIVTRNGTSYTSRTYLGNIGMSTLDTKGNETSGIAIAKKQQADGAVDPMYIAAKSKGLWSYRGGFTMMRISLENNAFMSFDYLPTSGGQYILYNDYNENYEKGDNSPKRKTVAAISEANTIYYKINNGAVSKGYLFGKPANDDVSKFCYIEASNYQPATGTYATLVVKRDGRKKVACVAWVKF